MKIIISKKRLEMAVKNICRVINKKNALPILDSILCMVDEPKKRLTLTGSDCEVWLHCQVDIDECEGSGEFCIDAKLMKKALAELKDQPLTIDINYIDEKMLLKHQTGTTQLPLLDHNEYPTPTWHDDTTTEWTLEASMLNRVMKRSVTFVADDELRPIMCGVFFKQTKEVLDIVASDGHVIIRNAEKVDNPTGSFNMPKKVAQLLPKTLTGSDDIKVEFGERLASFEQGPVSLVFRIIEGRYPNYMSVIPENPPHHLTTDRLSMLAAMRNVANFTVEASRMVKMHIGSDNTMTLYGEDWDIFAAANDRIDIEYPEAHPMSIGVKADTTIKILSLIAEPRIHIRFTDPSRALTITPDEPIYEGEELTIVIMPMMLND